MAYIKVDYQKMLKTAEQVDNYISRFDKNMGNIDTAVASLSVDWKGDDYEQVKTKWIEIYSAESTSNRMRVSLKSYAASIREAAKLYQEAQVRAINRAKTLCT